MECRDQWGSVGVRALHKNGVMCAYVRVSKKRVDRYDETLNSVWLDGWMRRKYKTGLSTFTCCMYIEKYVPSTHGQVESVGRFHSDCGGHQHVCCDSIPISHHLHG